MSAKHVTRRAFLGIAATAGVAAAVTGCPIQRRNGVVVYRRSGRGMHVSNAAKKHNANHLYASAIAAGLDAAHPGDNSKVVKVLINRETYTKLFGSGKLRVDLRHDL